MPSSVSIHLKAGDHWLSGMEKSLAERMGVLGALGCVAASLVSVHQFTFAMITQGVANKLLEKQSHALFESPCAG